jgi:hypothetical protein
MATLLRLLAATASLLAAGCVLDPYPAYRVTETSPPAAPALTPEDVLRLSKAGIAESVILEKIKSDGLSARPTADQVVSLKKEGLTDAVLSAMVSARVVTPSERTVQRVYTYPSYSYYPYYGYYGGWWGYPYGWSWGIGYPGYYYWRW